MIGRTIGTYKIEEKIGEGGMGTVYQGVDLMLERTVAVKVLRPALAQQPRVLDRFRSEAVTLARLNHPNIATLYSFLQDQNEYFMILEFVQGQTFEALLRRGAMPYEEAIPLFCQALDGIAHAHAHGIVHRDIKPANVMLTETGRVKVMDFGIARVLGTARMTRTGHLIGTIEYMSPEQVRGQETDARSDIYSLGVLLYEMLTGQVPFEADSDFELMQAHVQQAPRPLRALSPTVPAAVERAVLRALAKKPSARFPDGAAFRASLDQGLREATASAPGEQETGRGLVWLRRLLTPPPLSSTKPVNATRLAAENALAPETAPAVPETRQAEARETRRASEPASSAPLPPRRWIARLQHTPPWHYVAAAAPVLLAILAVLVWKPGSTTDTPADPDPSAQTPADTADALPTEPAPVVPAPAPDQPIARDQPTLLSPEEFARLNPSPQHPVDAPEAEPVTPPKQTPSRREPDRVAEEPTHGPKKPEAPRPGSVRVIIRPFGDVYVAGQRKARATNQPYIEAMTPGTYRVRAVHPSFGSWEKQVSVEPGKTHDVVFNFNHAYTLTVTSQPPNAEIIVDGASTGRYTPSVLTVRPGQHRIGVRKRGFSASGGSKQLTIEDNVKEPVHFTLRQNR